MRLFKIEDLYNPFKIFDLYKKALFFFPCIRRLACINRRFIKKGIVFFYAQLSLYKSKIYKEPFYPFTIPQDNNLIILLYEPLLVCAFYHSIEKNSMSLLFLLFFETFINFLFQQVGRPTKRFIKRRIIQLLTIGLEPITAKEQILSLSCLPISPSEPNRKKMKKLLSFVCKIFANKKKYKRYKITQKETKYLPLFVVFLQTKQNICYLFFYNI